MKENGSVYTAQFIKLCYSNIVSLQISSEFSGSYNIEKWQLVFLSFFALTLKPCD